MSSADPVVGLGVVRALGRLQNRLEAIHDPTLIVWGRDDLVVPASDSAGFVERITGARLEVFEDCGHVPMAERPVRFNRLLAAFASEPLPGGGPEPAEVASD